MSCSHCVRRPGPYPDGNAFCQLTSFGVCLPLMTLHSGSKVGVWPVCCLTHFLEGLAGWCKHWRACFPLKREKGGRYCRSSTGFEARPARARILGLRLHWQCDPGQVTPSEPP